MAEHVRLEGDFATGFCSVQYPNGAVVAVQQCKVKKLTHAVNPVTVVVSQCNEVLLVKQKNGNMWLPNGIIEMGEDALAAG